MARPRGQSFGEGLKVPHSISLKVLRLTRPSLQTQSPLPHTSPNAEDGLAISPKASLAYPLSDAEDGFILTPILQLPESFQSAYVGEVFSATLCANNELVPDSGKSVSNVKVQAEILTPSSGNVGKGLELEDAEAAQKEGEDGGGEDGRMLAVGETMQKILRLNLKEEGNHTLGVTVTYTETQHADEAQAAISAKVRTFRKLYQFVAVPLLGVRTKAGEVPAGKRNGRLRYAVEAQLENVGERPVVLEAVALSPKAPFTSQSLNWDVYGSGADPVHPPVLNPRDVLQVAFLLEEQGDSSKMPKREDAIADVLAVAPGEKFVLGQLNIQWTSAMGDRGSLSTGWLTAKR